MATKLTNWLNYAETGPELEINTEPSQTQPDEVLSIKEMLTRHVRGLPVDGGKEGVYYPEEMGYIPDLRTLDLTEIQDYQEHYQKESKRIQKELDERTAQQKKAEQEEAELQKQIKDEFKKSKNKTPDVESPS